MDMMSMLQPFYADNAKTDERERVLAHFAPFQWDTVQWLHASDVQSAEIGAFPAGVLGRAFAVLWQYGTATASEKLWARVVPKRVQKGVRKVLARGPWQVWGTHATVWCGGKGFTPDVPSGWIVSTIRVEGQRLKRAVAPRTLVVGGSVAEEVRHAHKHRMRKADRTPGDVYKTTYTFNRRYADCYHPTNQIAAAWFVLHQYANVTRVGKDESQVSRQKLWLPRADQKDMVSAKGWSPAPRLATQIRANGSAKARRARKAADNSLFASQVPPSMGYHDACTTFEVHQALKTAREMLTEHLDTVELRESA